jgi:nucleoside-diphosphate-sugar epimerase
VHIEDVVSANMYALENFQKFQGGVYEVSTGESHTFEEVLEIAGIQYKYADAELIPEGYQFYTKGSKQRHLNGWSPRVDLFTGVSSYIKHLATNG